MIRLAHGNLLESDAEALVNTVNEVGVMGKGIALMFRDAFPWNTEAYERAVKQKAVRVGRMLVVGNTGYIGPRWILNFPTKKHWRQPSRIEWIREGLQDLARVVRELGIKSIAIPPLGVGAGGLAWIAVRREIESSIAALNDVDVVLYQPTDAYLGKAKESGVEKLTPARALVAEMIRRYETLGLDCTILEVQKLAWFLGRSIAALALPDVLKLRFKANKFGPYDDRLRHLLNALDGSYLHSEKRLSDAGPFDLIRFEYSRQNMIAAYLRSVSARSYLPAIEQTSALIAGFESPLGMELLATVDWLIHEMGAQPTVESLHSTLENWPGGAEAVERKRAIFDDRMLAIALERLRYPPIANSSEGLFAVAG